MEKIMFDDNKTIQKGQLWGDYGFGAKLPPYFKVVSQCFSMKGDYFQPEVSGLKDLIKTYKKTINEVKFHGPTIFADIIDIIFKPIIFFSIKTS